MSSMNPIDNDFPEPWVINTYLQDRKSYDPGQVCTRKIVLDAGNQ